MKLYIFGFVIFFHDTFGFDHQQHRLVQGLVKELPSLNLTKSSNTKKIGRDFHS